MKIAVVILNWNGKKLLEQFLPSVVEHSNDATIYVVDNASTDDSIVFVSSNYPSIKIIKNSINGGFAKGYNDALKHIEADVFCLLNSDVEVTKNWITPIINVFENESNTAIIQPKILDYKNKDYFEYAGAAGGFIDKYGFPYCRGRLFNTLEQDIGQYDDIADIFWASGACFFVRSEVFKKLNGFDEHFFAHIEEIDLCWRAKNSGYNIKYVYQSKVYHLGGATLSKSNSKKTYLNFRNSLFTLIKNAKGPLFPVMFFRLTLDGVASVKFLFELKPSHSLAILKSHVSFYRYLPYYLKQRKLQKNKIKYFSKTSIVIDYFLNKKTTYKCL
ncbi:glycosyltransferase family 2 protein [Confluentibacter flavum]|uniref:dTDP-Rha--alpha-D-GlcNAc-pyrophosphate polyprenol alpha-3-L-rhamnosyltransferase n=1 Tax=Confluentibacter flavum TaxID=1909700 RepID=A0A2N3HNL1_9FLAO|nr:glycosyltransferase family 2 protein [Confluentibacter flavum]PKQ46550.1 dTDP-Rha--alpha-D-GlcNAc-pyrophosphate polyprenol alpha-3-L-rhamnosyltransferase [Confluentibacter flavum]